MDLFCFLSMWVVVLCILVAVAFFTLLERKILGYIQIRKGPNKVGFTGLFQPFADAVKLFTKYFNLPLKGNSMIFLLSPGVLLMNMLILWMVIPFLGGMVDFMLGLFFFLCITGLGVYCLFCSGWASNSKYSLLGALRGVAQTISYEVSMALILIGVSILGMTYNLYFYYWFQEYIIGLGFLIPLTICWLASIVAETNRSPFDFAEGESELVSGFNVEYSGGLFAMLFMAEYGMMLLMSMLSTCLFFCSKLWFGYCLMLVLMFLWIRGSFPRYRYDKLMMLIWKSYLPVVLFWVWGLVGFMGFLGVSSNSFKKM